MSDLAQFAAADVKDEDMGDRPLAYTGKKAGAGTLYSV
jgi:ribosomal protein S6